MTFIDFVKPYTMTNRDRVKAMAAALETIDREKIAGDVAECGVWRGGNIILARKMSPDRVCWLFDTFEGMNKPSEYDRKFNGHVKALAWYNNEVKKGTGWCRVPIEDVKGNLGVTGVLDEQKLRFVVGPVEDTLQKPENIPDQIALLRLDTDWHASTQIELEVLYPKLQSGGIMIIDDYGHWKGQQKAVDDYFAQQAIQFKPTWIDYGAVMMVKP